MKYAAEMILIAAAVVFASEAARARHNDLFVESVWKQLTSADDPVATLATRTSNTQFFSQEP